MMENVTLTIKAEPHHEGICIRSLGGRKMQVYTPAQTSAEAWYK
jgi:hypothetical protein